MTNDPAVSAITPDLDLEPFRRLAADCHRIGTSRGGVPWSKVGDDFVVLIAEIERLQAALLSSDRAVHPETLQSIQRREGVGVAEALRIQALREAFRAGFIAHPDAEAPVFAWSFDPNTCMATDREESAWNAWRLQFGKDSK